MKCKVISMLEKQVEEYFCREVKKHGGLALKLTSPGHAGVPDRVVLHDGKILFVELKRPGGKLRPLQRYVFSRMRKFGAKVYVITCRAEVDAFVQQELIKVKEE